MQPEASCNLKFCPSPQYAQAMQKVREESDRNIFMYIFASVLSFFYAVSDSLASRLGPSDLVLLSTQSFDCLIC